MGFLSRLGLEFHPEGFVQQLPRMGVGMLGVFMIVVIIILATYLIAKLTGEKKEKDEDS